MSKIRFVGPRPRLAVLIGLLLVGCWACSPEPPPDIGFEDDGTGAEQAGGQAGVSERNFLAGTWYTFGGSSGGGASHTYEFTRDWQYSYLGLLEPGGYQVTETGTYTISGDTLILEPIQSTAANPTTQVFTWWVSTNLSELVLTEPDGSSLDFDKQ